MSESEVKSLGDKIQAASLDTSGVLSFSGRGLKLDTENDAQESVKEIISAEYVEVLKFEGNTFGVDACKAIGESLEKHPELKRAKWSDMFTGRLKTEIPQALKYLCGGMKKAGVRLVELDLSDNAFGPNGMIGLEDFLVSECCFSLEELRLNNNGLGVTGGKMLAKCLTECYHASKKAGRPLALKVFVSGRGRLEDDGSRALADAFKLIGTLEEVQMPQNGITHVGITALSEAFKYNPNLQYINMNDNTFTDRGADSMAKALPNLQNLEVINFGDCLLKSKGAMSIANAIKASHTKLKFLNLSFNEISKQAASTVVEALANKNLLEKVDLDGNQFGSQGKQNVRNAMKNIGKEDTLTSLSDDEGDSDDEEENNDNDESGDEVDDPALSVNGVGLTPRPMDSTIENFLAFPSIKILRGIQGDGPQDMLDMLGDDIKNEEEVLRTFMKVSAVVTPDDEEAKTLACTYADVLFRSLLKDGDPGFTLPNAMLVHLGLIKSEEKRKAPNDITGSLLVLNHVFQQPYFPKPALSTMKLFLSRPHQLLQKSVKPHNQLMATLYGLC